MKKDSQKEPEGISRIMDGMINQITKTRQVFLILIGVIAVPLIGIIAITAGFLIILNDESMNTELREAIGEDVWILDWGFAVVIGFLVLLVFVIGFGIKQLFSLKQWTSKYEKFQRRLNEFDKKLDDELTKE